MRELGIYIHIPFCIAKCGYCDFLSAPADAMVRERYVERLTEELRQRKEGKKDHIVTSIFFGGGTPSVLTSQQTERILYTIRQEFGVAPDAEITTEANPGTLETDDKLFRYRRMGFNRLSLGVQSFHDRELRLLGRIHSAADAEACFWSARRAGFENINLDLMAALPGQTREGFCASLRRAVELSPEHLSVYSLIVEEGTPFYEKYGTDIRLRERGDRPQMLPDEETEREMYRDAEEILADAGYQHYEISNYARRGAICRHNDNCWLRKEYLGFGIGAASLYEECRFTDTSDLTGYFSGEFARVQEESLTVRAQMEETMFLGLRRLSGISEQDFYRKFGQSVRTIYGSQIARFCSQGLLCTENGRIFLTKKGLDLANYVMEGFLEDS